MVLIILGLVLLVIIGHNQWLRTRHGKCEECGKVFNYDEVFKQKKLKRIGKKVLCENCANKVSKLDNPFAGRSFNDRPDRIEKDAIATEKFEVDSGIDSLIKEANKYYPHQFDKAYPIFKKAILLFPDTKEMEVPMRGNSTSMRSSEVEFACWAAWVCYTAIFPLKQEDDSEDSKDTRNIETDVEYQELIALIGRKCPSVLLNIEERRRESNGEAVREDEFCQVISEIFSILRAEVKDGASLKEKMVTLQNMADSRNCWWQVRDMANSIVREGLDRDTAWSLYNLALFNRMKNKGDLSTIYEPMGFLRKEEGNFFDATKCFILAYCQTPKKTSEKQIGICLRKLGVKGNCQEVQDKVCKVFSEEGVDAGIRYLKGISL